MRIKDSFTVNKLFHVTVALTAFVQMAPFFIWRDYWDGAFSFLKNGLLIISFIGMFFHIVARNDFPRSSLNPKNGTITLILVAILFYHYYSTKFVFQAGIGTVLIIVEILYFMSIDKNEQADTFNIFKTIFALSLIPSFLWTLLINVGINLPVSVIDNSIGDSVYYMLGGVVSDGAFSRLAGMLDEPGLVGTVSALLLVSENFNLKKKINWILLVCGVLSFSLAFFIISVIGYSCKLISSKNAGSALALVLAVIIYILFTVIPFSSPALHNLQKRIKIEDGELAGDNRSSEALDMALEEQFSSGDINEILFGYGMSASQNRESLQGNDSYKNIIYNHGILGLIYLALVLILVALKYKRNWKTMLFVFLFILSIYQRSGVVSYHYFVIFIGGLSTIYLRDTKETIENGC